MNEEHKPPTWGWLVASTGEVKRSGLFRLKVQFKYTRTEEVESQDLLLLTDPRSKDAQ